MAEKRKSKKDSANRKRFNKFQKAVTRFLAMEILSMERDLYKGVNIRNRLIVVSRYAFALYWDLQDEKGKPKFSSALIKNREGTPNEPMFFQNIDVLKNFEKMLNTHIQIAFRARENFL